MYYKKMNIVLIAGIIVLTNLLSGCGMIEQKEQVKEAEQLEETGQNANVVEFTDALGYEVTISNPQKTAVMTGSYADAWQLAGGTVSAATEDAKDSIEWNEEIISLGSIKEPSVETIIATGIDFAILSASVSADIEMRETLENAGITTAYFDVETFEEYAAMMDILTDITGRKDLYEQNVISIQETIDEQISRQDGTQPTVLFLRAYSSGVTVKNSDSMTGKMLKDLGCINIADSETSLLENLSMEAIIAQDPDYIFVTTMGDSLEEAMKMMDELLISNPAWSGLKAVKNGHYFVLEKELFSSKPNERWAESYQILADDLYGNE